MRPRQAYRIRPITTNHFEESLRLGDPPRPPARTIYLQASLMLLFIAGCLVIAGLWARP